MCLQWAAENQAEPVQKYPGSCLRLVLDRTHHCDKSCTGSRAGRFGLLAHQEWWQDRQGNLILIAHPYDLDELPQLATFCQEQQMECQALEPEHSWYAPHLTYRIQIRAPQAVR
jgi:hypothetical protein